MTTRDLAVLLARRWYVVLLGMAVTLGAIVLTERPGVYWTQFDMVLLGPRNVDFPTNIEDPRVGMVPMASVIVTELNGSDRPLLMGSSDTTLYGEGVRRGSRVRLPNYGSQWSPLYTAPIIDIQVVDSTEDVVAVKAAELAQEVRDTLDRRQNEIGVVPTMQMSVIKSPEDPLIQYVTGRRSRSLLGWALAGAGGTVAAAYWFDRAMRAWTDRRRKTRARVGS